MNQCNTIKIYTIFTQQQDTNSIQVPIDYKPGNTRTYHGDIKQGTKISWSKGIEIIQNLFSYHTKSVLLSLWNYVENQYQKIFENNPYIFKCNVTFTKRDLCLSH